jgi:hypothetical protein
LRSDPLQNPGPLKKVEQSRFRYHARPLLYRVSRAWIPGGSGTVAGRICGTLNYIAHGQRYCLTRQTDTASRLTPGPLALFYTPFLLAIHLSRPRASVGSLRRARRCFAKHTLFRRICDNQYEFTPHRDVSQLSLDACELVQQILTPSPQERSTLHSIIDHTFFTHSIVPGFMPFSAQDVPPPQFPSHLASHLTSKSHSVATDVSLR